MNTSNVIMRLKVGSYHNWVSFFNTKINWILRLIWKIRTKRSKTIKDFKSYQLEPYLIETTSYLLRGIVKSGFGPNTFFFFK